MLFSSTTIDSISIGTLSGLINLTNLELVNNNLSDISPLSELTNLTHVYLWDNSIITGVTALTTLINAERIDLRNNSGINSADITTLSDALPDCTIRWP